MTQIAQSVAGSSLFTVTAPSGAGKSSLLSELIRKYSDIATVGFAYHPGTSARRRKRT